MGNNKTTRVKVQAAIHQLKRQSTKQRTYGEEMVSKPPRKKDRAAVYAEKQSGREARLCEAIDMIAALKKAVPKLQDYVDGKISADVAFSHIAPASLLQLVKIMSEGESEKNQLDAAKHLLALAGHIPAQRHEIGRMDASTPKAALITLLQSNQKTLNEAGIEIVEDDDDKNKA